MAVAGLGLTGCGLKEPPPFDPVTLQDPEVKASFQGPKEPMYDIPTTLIDLSTQPANDESSSEAARNRSGTRPATAPVNRRVHLRPSSPAATGRSLDQDLVVRMSLQDIIHRSVIYSAEVKVAGYDPAIAKTRVLEAEARFDPTLFINLKYEHQDQPLAGERTTQQFTQLPVTLNVNRGEVLTVEPGIKQLLETGGEVSFSYQSQYNYLLPAGVRFIRNAFWDDTLKFQLTQPLLRNAGYAVNQARITIARNDAHVSILDFRKTLEDNIAELEKDYWQSQEAEQEVRIQERLLDNTRKTARILFERAQRGGDVSRVQTSQAQASIRDREAVLIRARARLRDISDDIKKRMNDPDFPVAGEITILPLDMPSEHKIEFSRPEQIATAVANRLELAQQKLRIDDSAVALLVAINNAYPKLDLTAAITVEGIGSPNSTKGKPADMNPNGASFGDSIRAQWENDGHIGYSLAFAFELPIGNREARAIVRRAYLQRLQAMWQYKNLVAQVVLDVTTALREVQTSWNEIGARRQARFAQADELGAYEDRRINGEALTPTFVQLILDGQERLANSEREEALAIASYEVAVARLERAKGTLLRYNNVMVAEEQFKAMDR
jgi:outer membrane protein TolC